MFEFFITRPLGWIIHLIYSLVKDYGLTIIFFTVAVKLLLLPLQVKSQKGMRKQQKIQPMLAELQKKYANDKEKLQMEMMKLYKENNVSMTGGCLPLLIQFPILIGLYQVIQRPITYILQLDFKAQNVVTEIGDIVNRILLDPNQSIAGKFAKFVGKTPEAISEIVSKDQINFLWYPDHLGLTNWHIDFNFLGLDLSRNPSAGAMALFSGNFSALSTILLLLIPAIAIFATWFSARQTQKMSGNPQANSPTGMAKTMNYIMPIMTGIFTFTLPALMGLYWIVSSVMQIVTQYLINVYFDKKGDDFVVKIPEKNRKNGKKR